MRRKLTVGERIMYVDALTPLNAVFAVKIRGSITLEQLHAALQKIQQKHYLLRTAIEEDKNGAPYFVAIDNINEIPVRVVDRHSDEDWKVQSKIEWGQLFDGANMPLARVVWLKGDEVSDILLACPHCIGDGTTFTALMSELLLLLDQPESELVPYPSFAAVQELVAESFTPTNKQVFRSRVFSVLASVFFLFKPTRNKKPLGDSYLLHWKLSTEDTTALVVASKANGVTIHAALSVAFLEAFLQVKGRGAHGKAISPVDIRRFIKEIKEDHMFAFAPIVEVAIDKDSNTDFWTKARKFKDDLTAKIEAMKVYELLVMSEYFHSSVGKMVKYLKSTDGTHDVTLSNMGRLNIAENYSSFEVETIYCPTVAFPWRNPNTLLVSTFKGQMDFTLCSNDAFLTPQEASAIKDKALLLLLQEEVPSYA